MSGIRIAWVLPTLALLAILLPTYHDAALQSWKQAENAYAPLLTALAFCLLAFRLRERGPAPEAGLPAPDLGLFAFGAALYVVGRSQRIDLLELGALIPLLAAVISMVYGRAALRKSRFALLFLLFSLPYPGWIIDGLSGPLKEWVSAAAESVLYAAGYPIARSGVVLALGQYRLLVADACSGLHSLIFLSALGLLYVHLGGFRPVWHRAALLTALLPIAVLANLIRVVTLLLLTYHFGDAVGQGYWHDLAGLILFISAFATLTGLDRTLARLRPAPAGKRESDTVRASTTAAGASLGRSLSVALMLLATATAAIALAPAQLLAERRPLLDLESQIPQRLGGWTRDADADVLLVAPELRSSVERIYSQTIARTYVDREGRRIMLSIAYGGDQLGNALQAHRPEYCYKAQGFRLADSSDVTVPLRSGALPVRRLVARQGSRTEPITYWMTVGELPALPGIQRKLAQLRYGLRGEIADGMLIRISSLDDNPQNAFTLHASFITALQDALPQSLRFILATAPSGLSPT